ncbi:MAG: hypothetical protein CMD27_03535 [Flavobacteriales bacterium]|nr:hypothetical protein [Flavobacteriales bacterium]
MSRITIKKIRKIYLSFSILLGFISPLICLYLFPEFDPRQHPVSYFGILQNTSGIFMISLIIFSIAILWNGTTIIRKLIKKQKYSIWLHWILVFSSICLFLTGIINMDFGPFHQIPALFFFLSYNFFIFLFGLIRATSYVRKGLFSVIIGSAMLLSSLLLIPFPSYGVAEIVYIFFILFWNITMWFQKKNQYS